MATKLDEALAVLNGAVGDMLARTGNGLQLEMGLVRGGRPVPIEREALARACPDVTGRVVVLVHGLMCTESIWTLPDASDYGSLLARDHPVPLLPEIQHFLVAGSLSRDPLVTRVFGDALVPVASATDGACTNAATRALPPSHIRFRPGLGHLALAHHPTVYEDIRGFLEETT